MGHKQPLQFFDGSAGDFPSVYTMPVPSTISANGLAERATRKITAAARWPGIKECLLKQARKGRLEVATQRKELRRFSVVATIAHIPAIPLDFMNVYNIYPAMDKMLTERRNFFLSSLPRRLVLLRLFPAAYLPFASTVPA